MKQKHIGYEVKSLNNMIRRKLDNLFSTPEFDELTGMQNHVLGFVLDQSKERDIFQKDIEKEFNIRRSTATVLIQTLEQKECLTRESVPYDARLKKIILTKKAISLQKKVRANLSEFNRVLEQNMTKEELDELYRLLDKVKENVKE